MNQMHLKALGKINLGLDVIGKRQDGYHEVRMIMQTVNVYDQVDLHLLDKPGIQVKTNLFYLPVNENNLAYQAAKLLLDEFDRKTGVEIVLKKHIPVAAGMAGGSSDAAAVLFGLNRLLRLGLTLEQLMKRALALGADVPYCLMRGTALAEGIGEKLTRIPKSPPCWLVIAKPSVSVSTKFVYGNLKLDEITKHPDIDGMIEAIKKQDIKGMASCLGNVLETVTIPAYPVIRELKEQLLSGGALGALMSGSGPTVFALFDQKETAKKAYRSLKAQGLAKQIFLTTFFNV